MMHTFPQQLLLAMVIGLSYEYSGQASPSESWFHNQTKLKFLVPSLFLVGSLESHHTKPYYHHRRVGASYHRGHLYREVQRSPSHHELESFDLNTHTIRHTYPLTHELSARTLVDDSAVFTFTRDGKITKFALNNTIPVWQTTLSSYVIQRVQRAGDLYVVTAYGDVVRIDGQSSEILWISSLTDPASVLYYHEDSIALKGRRLYVGSRHTVEVFHVRGDWLGSFNTQKKTINSSSIHDHGSVVGELTFKDKKIHFVHFDGTSYVFHTKRLKAPPIATRDLGTSITAKQYTTTGTYYGSAYGDLIYVPHSLDPNEHTPQAQTKTYKISDDPISSITLLHPQPSSSHWQLNEPLLITTAKGKLIGRAEQGTEEIFSATLAASIHAKPVVVSQSADRHMITDGLRVFITSAHKHVYGYRIITKTYSTY